MAHKFKLDFDGQSVVQADYNGLAVEASTGEDHVYAELFRLTPDNAGTISRGIIPYGTNALIVANGASGSILVNPFRALIGSRTLAATDAVANWQDVRTALSVADGATALTTQVSFAANATGNSRWNALYAAVSIDTNSTPTTRKVKNPGTALVTDESVSVYSRTSVTIGSVAGTAAATPTFPAIPADAGNIYYVLLGYVRIPTGFTAGSTVANKDIVDASASVTISAATGTSVLRPANQNSSATGAGVTGAGTSVSNGVIKQSGTAAQRAAAYIPPSMQGSESIIVAVDFTNASSANWSHQSEAIIDDSRDWRNRLCRWVARVGTDSADAAKFPWQNNSSNMFPPSTVNSQMPGYVPSSGSSALVHGFGWTNATDTNTVELRASGAAAATTPAAGSNVPTAVMVSGSYISIYADSTTGALKMHVDGAPLVACILWLDFSAQYPNL